MRMESLSIRINLAEVAKTTKSKLETTLNELRKTDGKFAEKPDDFQSGAKANLRFIQEHVSGDLEEICICMGLVEKRSLVVNFSSGVKLARIFSPESFVRLNGQKLELIKPNSDFSEKDNVPEILEDAKAVEKLWEKGGEAKKAIANFGKLSKEEVLLRVIKTIVPFVKAK